MTPYQKRLTAMTQRMAEDMKIRHLAQATIDAYTYHVGRFAEFLGKDLKKATPEDVRDFQLEMIEVRKLGWSSFNQAVCGLRFLYTVIGKSIVRRSISFRARHPIGPMPTPRSKKRSRPQPSEPRLPRTSHRT